MYVSENKEFEYIRIDVLTIMDSLFLVAAVLISFGAVIGKSSPLQLCVMMFFETILYSVNKSLLLLGVVKFVDGTMRLLTFLFI